MGVYRRLLLLLCPNPDEENDLYHPFIPPTPAFLKRISVLTILSENKTTSKTNRAIGNGRTTDKKVAIPR
jgi:hypothetical protein